MRRLNGFLFIFVFALSSVVFAQESSPVVLGEVAYEAGERRDPFLPLVGPDGEVKFSFDTTDITIEGIIYDPNQGSLVLIGGEFYQQGDRVGNANIISIYQNHVILEQESEQKTLWIREEILDPNQVKQSL